MNMNATSTRILSAMRNLAVACAAFVTVTLASAQDYVPDLGPAFLADEVATVRLTLAAEDLDFILNPDNAYSNVEWPGTFVYESSLGIDTVSNVGIRLRGNTSRTAGKKSFKVSFNTFTAGGKWNDLEKLNLNGNHNDPSVLRARMVWDYMRDQGYVTPRISHVKLYINEEYRGLYINVEHVDEEFLKKRFKHDHGNLWKCTYPADLADLGDNPESYKFTPSWNGEQRVYELKTNETADDYSAIRDLCHTVGSASDDFECALEAVFDVDGFLKLAAAEIWWATGTTTSATNNYLYERPSDGRLMMICYDPDNTLGIEWGGNWAEPIRVRLGPMGHQTSVRPHDAGRAIPNAVGVVHPRIDRKWVLQRCGVAPAWEHPAHAHHRCRVGRQLQNPRLQLQRRRLPEQPDHSMGWTRDAGHRFVRGHPRFFSLHPNGRCPIPSGHSSMRVITCGGRHFACQG